MSGTSGIGRGSFWGLSFGIEEVPVDPMVNENWMECCRKM